MKIKKILSVCALIAFPLSSFANANYWQVDSGGYWNTSDGKCLESGSFDRANGPTVGCDVMIKVERQIQLLPRPRHAMPRGPERQVERINLVQPQVREQVHEGRVHFEFDSYMLSERAKATLDMLYDSMRSGQAIEIAIIGHADRLGGEAYNMTLSQRRALAVREYLISLGASKLIMTLDARGEEEPEVACDGVKKRQELIRCLAPNRRAVVYVRIME